MRRSTVEVWRSIAKRRMLTKIEHCQDNLTLGFEVKLVFSTMAG